ncbi:unknown [Mycoplasma sp. CAG:472]|mgnify:FL=1|nr:unknown [Mycoplasma sp. CAG:472]
METAPVVEGEKKEETDKNGLPKVSKPVKIICTVVVLLVAIILVVVLVKRFFMVN